MKKCSALTLVFVIIMAMALPLGAGAAANSIRYYQSDFEAAKEITGTAYNVYFGTFFKNGTTTGSPSISEKNGRYAFSFTNSASGTISFDIVRSQFAQADYTPQYRKVTLNFKISGDDVDSAKMLWPSLGVMSVKTAKAKTSSNNTQAQTALAAMDENASVVCFDGSAGFAAGFVYPVCGIDLAGEHTVEYVYSYVPGAAANSSASQKKAISLKLDGKEVSTMLDGKPLYEYSLSTHGNLNFDSSSYAAWGGTAAPTSGERARLFMMEKAAEGKTATLDVYNLRYEGVTPGSLTAVGEAEGFGTGGKAVFTFNGDVKPESIKTELKENGQERVAPAGSYDSAAKTYTVDFANAPLHPGSSYTLTLTGAQAENVLDGGALTEPVTVAISPTADGYYINENFETYPAAETALNGQGAFFSPWFSKPGHGAQPNSLTKHDSQTAVHLGIRDGYAGNRNMALQFVNSKLPQVSAGDIKVGEAEFSFSGTTESTQIYVWTYFFYIKQDENKQPYLYVRANSGDKKLAPVNEGERNTIRVAYTANGANDRWLHRVTVNGTEYTQTADGMTFTGNIFKLSTHGGYALEMTNSSAAIDLFRIADTDNQTAAEDLYIYKAKYYSYKNEAGADSELTASAATAESGIDVTVRLEDYAGTARQETLVAAAYDAAGSRLLDVKVISASLPKLGILERTVSLDTKGEENAVIKVLRLNSLDELKPISAAVPVAVR